ncbi:MAG TPA: exodeoxyribonuclease VII small subunit [Thermoanaerobacterales bacterium]|nr:exodeoxyribonuclease VII small subunit [Thermoanaerobacterales bacterium]
MSIKKLSFESALKELEEIVDMLEKGELSIEEALEKFEKGVKLAQFCTSKLNEIEGKVSVLVEKENGEIKLEELEYSEEE